MFREIGSDKIEIIGGRRDGAVGTIVETTEEDGVPVMRVMLTSGQLVTVSVELPEAAGGGGDDEDLPREQGT